MTNIYGLYKHCLLRSGNNDTPPDSTNLSSHRIRGLIKKALKPILFCTRRRKRNHSTSFSCESSSSVESVTVIDGDKDQQSWITPSNYHKSRSGNKEQILSASADNHWIFRTGWTPQPDPLAKIDSGWCSQCHFCVKKNLGYCSSCQAVPLVLSQHRLALGRTEE